jgi:translation elongation factor EF-4
MTSDSERVLQLKREISDLVKEFLERTNQILPDTHKELLLQLVAEKEKQLTEKEKQITAKAAAVDSSANKHECEVYIEQTLVELKQMFDCRPLLQLPNDKMCQDRYDQNQEGTRGFNSYSYIRPYRMWKTTSLYKLYLCLQDNSVKSLYVDLL